MTESVDRQIPTISQRTHPKGVGSEAEFYSRHKWALNPVLSVRELFQHFTEAVELLETLHTPWQIEECKTNLYLFACALACTIDDYLGEPPKNLSKLYRALPQSRIPLSIAQKLINLFHRMSGFPKKVEVAAWRAKWTPTVDRVCALLLEPGKPSADTLHVLKRELQTQLHLPADVLRRRMQLPSGYRSQDLSHHDAVALADKFAASQSDRRSPLLVLGPRSMGAYLAPAVAARLSELGWSSVTWLTLRPKKGISPLERRTLLALLGSQVQVLIVDESPNTGSTFSLMIDLLYQCGAAPDQITLLVALHPTQPGWRVPAAETTKGVRAIYLDARDLHKNHFLEPLSVLPLLEDYFQARGFEAVEIVPSHSIDELNAQLDEHFQDGFQCRLKRVIQVRVRKEGETASVARVLAKSVGWGWLGYHAFFAGQELDGFVPDVLGLRDGILFMEWLEPGEANDNELPIATFANYVAARAGKLQINEDPTFAISPAYGWTAWSVLIDTLKPAFGPVVGRLKIPVIRQHLKPFVAASPAMTDGQMRPVDWLKTENGYRKIDFEHHNFGRTELYITDPAYDLASTVCEFQLSPVDERELLARYTEASGDTTVEERLLLWKLLHGAVVMGQASAALARESRSSSRDLWHQRMFLARNFLVHQMNRFSASLLPNRQPAPWTSRVIFLDLDGVFDTEIFGFPQATVSSLIALAKLQSHDFSVTLNTARGIVDVRHYVHTYGLQGGIAESGCVFLDAVTGQEFSLVDRDSVEQLRQCRSAISSLPGVVVDPNYSTAVRAFRYSGKRITGLSPAEIEDVVTKSRFDKLTFITTSADTTVLPMGISKGSALLRAKQYLRLDGHPVAAVGDNDQDIDMLRAAEFAYAPADSSPAVRALAAKGECSLTREPQQRGLLEAVAKIIHPDGQLCQQCDVHLKRPTGCGDLFLGLMAAKERSQRSRLFSIFDRVGL